MRSILIFTSLLISINVYSDKIVSTMPSLTEMVYFLELEKNLVGVTPFCKFPVQAQRLPKIGTSLSLDYEKIVKLAPRAVLMGPVVSGQVEENLKKMSIEVVKVRYDRLSDVVDGLLQLNKKFKAGKEEKITTLIRALHKTKGASNKRVLIVIGEEIKNGHVLNVHVAGKETFYDDILQQLGAVNVIENTSVKYPLLNLESLLKLKSDIIIRVGDKSPLNDEVRSLWRTTVFKDQVRFIFKSYTVIPGPRIINLIKEMRNIL